MILKKFKSHILSCAYFTAAGLQVAFINGEYVTGNETVIAELEAEVKNGHPHIYIDPKDSEVDTEALTPIEIIRQEAYEQAKRDLMAIMTTNKDFGNDNPNPFAQSLANSRTVSEVIDGEAKPVEAKIELVEAGQTVVGAVTLSPVELLKAKAAAAAASK